MNRTFKVVFNKARGVLMVANEITSSVQKKGTKQVVTAAVTMALSGVIGAADLTVDSEINIQEPVEYDSVTVENGGKLTTPLKDNSFLAGSVTLNEGGIFNVTELNSDADSDGTADRLLMAGTDLTLNGGRVQVDSKEFEGYLKLGTAQYGGSMTVEKGAYKLDTMEFGSSGEAQLNVNGGSLEIGSFDATDGTTNIGESGKLTVGSVELANGKINNSGKFSAETVEVNAGGVINTALVNDSFLADSVTLNEGGIFNVTELNSDADSDGTADRLLMAGTDLTLNGGRVQVDSKEFEGYLKLGTAQYGGSMTVEKGAYKLDTMEFGSSGKAQLNVNDGSLDIGSFDATDGTTNIGESGKLTIGSVELANGVINNSGKFSAETVEVNAGGAINTALVNDSFLADSVTLNEDGIFNVTELNSDADSDGTADRLLMAGTDLTLNGGRVQVAGNEFEGYLKLGTAQYGGTMTIAKGEYSLSSIEFGSSGEAKVQINGGKLSVEKINLNNGSITVSGSGTLETSSDQALNVEGSLFAATQDAAQDVAEVSLKTGLTFGEGGELALTDEGFYTTGSLTQMVEALKNNGTIVIVNAEFAPGEAGGLGAIIDNVVQGTVDAEVSADPDGSGVVKINPNNAGSQSLTVTNSDAKSLEIAGGSSFTLVGSVEEVALVKNEVGKDLGVTVASDTTLNMGIASAETETKGSLSTLTVNGKAQVVNMTATVEEMNLGSNAVVNVGNADKRGTLDVDTLTMGQGSVIFLDPAVFGTVDDASHFGVEKVESIAGEIVSGQNAIVSLGANTTTGAAAVDKVIRANGLVWGKDVTAAVYLGSAVTVDTTGYVVADGSLTNEDFTSADDAGYDAGKISVADKGLLAADQQAVSGTDPLVTGTVAFNTGSTLAIVNATEGEFTLATTVEGAENTTVITDNPFYNAALQDGGKVVTAQDNENGVASIASAGIQAMTRRADFMLSQTVADRASVDQEMQPGVNLWVDVAGENYQMDGMDYGAEFEADTFYGSFGGDIKLGDAYTVGAAFQYGDGSLRSSVNGVKNDVTNYGLAFYGTAKFGDAKVVGELSYIWGENDITAAQSAMNQSVDTAVYSAGVTGMYELRAGGFSFVPSIGLRISQLETDAMHVGDVTIADQDQTLVQIPVALRINGADMTAGGWKLAPSFKIAYVPTFGDTEIDVRNIETDVIDTSPVQMDFGLRAGTDNLLINAAFSLGAGKEGSSSIGGKVGLKYAF